VAKVLAVGEIGRSLSPEAGCPDAVADVALE
jgi:hypothetical protein